VVEKGDSYAAAERVLKMTHIQLAVIGLMLGSSLMAAPFGFTTIDFPGSPSTGAVGINGSGQIVGSYSSNGNQFLSDGFLLSGGVFTTIDVPGANTLARGINNRGEIVGVSVGTKIQGFLRNGNLVTLIDYPGALFATDANGINDNGQIVGIYQQSFGGDEHGFLLSNSVFTPIDFPGASDTIPYGINNLGQIVGSYILARGTGIHGFLLSNGVFTTIDFPGNSFTNALGINNLGQIVGSYNGSGGGFLLSGGVFTTLDLPGSPFITEAHGINDKGEIVGFYQTSSGVIAHGFLATPVPEPGTALPVTVVVSGLLVWFHRRRSQQ
jgi:uncharacterized membrane protein